MNKKIWLTFAVLLPLTISQTGAVQAKGDHGSAHHGAAQHAAGPHATGATANPHHHRRTQLVGDFNGEGAGSTAQAHEGRRIMGEWTGAGDRINTIGTRRKNRRLTADWNGDGTDTIGLRKANSGIVARYSSSADANLYGSQMPASGRRGIVVNGLDGNDAINPVNSKAYRRHYNRTYSHLAPEIQDRIKDGNGKTMMSQSNGQSQPIESFSINYATAPNKHLTKTGTGTLTY